MDGTGYTVVIFVAMVIAFAAMAVAVMFSRHYGKRFDGGGKRGASAGYGFEELAVELRRTNDLVEQRVAELDARLRQLEDRSTGSNGKD